MKGGDDEMDTTTEERIDEYLEVYGRVKAVVKDAEVVAVVIEQVGKDSRCACLMEGRSNGNGNGNGEQRATEKQIGFMESLGIDVPADCTKREASRLIDEAQAA